jgi:hypothetical protein
MIVLVSYGVFKINSYFPPDQLTGALVRAGRALAGVSAKDLAEASKLGLATVRRAEASDGPLKITRANAERLIEALEARGVVLVPPNGGGAGVRLKS